MKILFITNVLTPYRMFLFDKINAILEKNGGGISVAVMMAPDHNSYWHYDDYKRNYTFLLPVLYIKNKSDYFINFHIKKAFKEVNPDVVIASGAYWYPTIIRIIELCKKNKRIILWWSESNKMKYKDVKGSKLAIRELLRKYTYRKVDGFIYPGKYAFDLIRDYSRENSFEFMLPNIVDNTKYGQQYDRDTVREILGITNNKIILFCPARLSEEKGLLPFMELLKKSELRNKSKILIAGGGPLKEQIIQFINDNNLDIELLGYVPQEKMIQYYQACDYFLLPSYVDPSPLACVEALWCGKPLLISNSVGNGPEVLKDGINGYSFDYQNKNDAISTLNRLPNPDSEWYKLACNESRRIAAKDFDPEQLTSDLIMALEKIFGE